MNRWSNGDWIKSNRLYKAIHSCNIYSQASVLFVDQITNISHWVSIDDIKDIKIGKLYTFKILGHERQIKTKLVVSVKYHGKPVPVSGHNIFMFRRVKNV